MSVSSAAFLSGLGMGLGLIVAIGAQNVFVLRQAIKREFVAEVVAICIASDILCITLGVAGVGAMIKAHPLVVMLVQYGGAAFLAYYGVLALRRALAGQSVLSTQSTTPTANTFRKVVLACLGFTFLNPHMYLDTVVLLGSLSTTYHNGEQWIFAAGAYAASTLWFCVLGWGGKKLIPLFSNSRAWQIFDGLIALIMFVLAYQLGSSSLV